MFNRQAYFNQIAFNGITIAIAPIPPYEVRIGLTINKRIDKSIQVNKVSSIYRNIEKEVGRVGDIIKEKSDIKKIKTDISRESVMKMLSEKGLKIKDKKSEDVNIVEMLDLNIYLSEEREDVIRILKEYTEDKKIRERKLENLEV